MNAIEFKDVKKYYWLFDNDIKKIPWLFTHKGHVMEKRAVDGVSFKIKKGEVVGFIGSNGAGKSTILKLIAGITKPNSGKITVQGNVMSLINLNAGLVNEFTGRQNLYYKASLMGIPRKIIETKINDIIEFADIGEYIDIPIKTYSTGMRARLGFSLAVYSDPDILLVDEVFSVGDRRFRQKSKKKTEELIKSNKTVVIVSHSEETMKSFADRCIYLNNGKIEYEGNTNVALELYNK